MIRNIEGAQELYAYKLRITGNTEYGVSLQSILAGETPIPPEGARFDVAFEGAMVEGSKLSGAVRGVDYLWMRADGRAELDIKAEITAPDGTKVALRADGVVTPRPGEPIADLWENVKLHSSHEQHRWVNSIQIWGTGTVNFATGEIEVHAYTV